MMDQSNYQEIEMPNGTYIVEKRVGHWMAWAPDSNDPIIVDHSYDMVMLVLNVHSKTQGSKLQNSKGS